MKLSRRLLKFALLLFVPALALACALTDALIAPPPPESQSASPPGPALATASPAPTAGQLPVSTLEPARAPTYGALTFSAGYDENAQHPLNPAKSFPYGTLVIFADWTFRDVAAGTALDVEWFRNSVSIERNSTAVRQTTGRTFQWLGYRAAPALPLDAGEYRCVVRAGDQVILSDTFVILPPGDAGTNVLTVFFTIQNGVPAGYVVDKQGITHTPAGDRTISDFYVSIGDRIIIQTDQPRFSLLFDCGDSPQTYSPCDFSADAPARLPTLIRKNRNGTAYLNLSRAGNWGDLRPEFEPQRYPAEPVLRIDLHD